MKKTIESTSQIGNWVHAPIHQNHWQLYKNYVWETQINNQTCKQQIALQPTPSCQNRGNYKATYDVVSCLDVNRFLTCYYFEEKIAVQEVQNWAKIIDETQGLKFTGLYIDYCTVELYQNKYFDILLVPVELNFTDNKKVDAWRLAPELKDDRFKLENNDLFPRYYSTQNYAEIERNQWVDVWKKQYQALDN